MNSDEVQLENDTAVVTAQVALRKLRTTAPAWDAFEEVAARLFDCDASYAAAAALGAAPVAEVLTDARSSSAGHDALSAAGRQLVSEVAAAGRPAAGGNTCLSSCPARACSGCTSCIMQQHANMKRALQGLREQESRPEVSVLTAQRQSGCAVC